MSPRTRLALLAGAGLALSAAVLLDRWNRQLEAAVELPRRHPSIPGSLVAPDEVQQVPPELLDRLQRLPRTEVEGRCSSFRTDGQGHTTHSCSFHPGHENDHRDVHTGATWV